MSGISYGTLRGPNLDLKTHLLIPITLCVAVQEILIGSTIHRPGLVLELDTRLGLDALFIGMLDLPHLSHQVGVIN